MEWSATTIAATGTAIVAIIGAIAKAFQGIRANNLTIKENNRKFDRLWHGTIARGYVEAQNCGHLQQLPDGTLVITPAARTIYVAIGKDLKELYKSTQQRLGRPPSKFEFTWAIEDDEYLQTWIIDNACKALVMSQHGCLAIAYELVMAEKQLPKKHS